MGRTAVRQGVGHDLALLRAARRQPGVICKRGAGEAEPEDRRGHEDVKVSHVYVLLARLAFLRGVWPRQTCNSVDAGFRDEVCPDGCSRAACLAQVREAGVNVAFDPYTREDWHD